MSVFKHIVYNPMLGSLKDVLEKVEKEDPTWRLYLVYPVNEVECVCIFEKEVEK